MVYGSRLATLFILPVRNTIVGIGAFSSSLIGIPWALLWGFGHEPLHRV